MYETLVNTDESLSLAAMVAWLVTGYRAGRIALRPTPYDRRRTARIVLGLLVVDGLLLLGKLTTGVLLWASVGWPFAQNRAFVELPLLLAGVIAVVLLAVPRLRRLVRRPDAALDRVAAAESRLVVPVQATAVAAVLGLWIAFVARPVSPFWPDTLWYGALLGAATGVLWLRQRDRVAWLGRPDVRVPGGRSRVLRAAGTVLALLAAGVVGLVTAAQASVLPGEYSMMDHGSAGHDHGTAHPGGETSVTSLTGAVDGVPDRSFTLTAAPTTLPLASGGTVQAWAFNGRSPGPELRVHAGELVEVTLVNDLPDAGVTIHWHGVDLANAADGVAGLTQDAVPPGGRYVYRFRAPDIGTYWYHSHQQSSVQVQRGLFGPLVVLPPDQPLEPAATVVDRTVLSHTWDTGAGNRKAFGTADGVTRETVPAGTPVRLRVVNTDNGTLHVALAGTPFRVAAIDGVDLHAPTELVDTQIRVAASGRDDIVFTMPDHPVLLAGVSFDTGPGLLLSPDGTGDAPEVRTDREFDPLSYGSPAPTPFDATTPVDRDYTLVLDDGPDFFDGRFGFHSTINGASFPDTPMLMVREGDLVRTTFVNRSHSQHPIHLHGHHALVLSRNGVPSTGSPWWVDSVEVRPGETFVIAFRADNPGLWMDHCHNLDHAATGMTMHLAYEGVTTPFRAGRDTVNQPE